MHQETVEIVPDESMHTTEGRSNRTMVATTLVKLHRAGRLTDDDFLVASELANDWARITRPAGGGGNLERCGEEEFVIMPGARNGVEGASTARADACERINDARKAVAHAANFMLVITTLRGRALEDNDAIRKCRRGTSSSIFCGAIKTINAARIYEIRRHRSAIMAAA
jgi:hypothetical protein